MSTKDYGTLKVQAIEIYVFGKWQTEKKSITKPHICVNRKFSSLISQ